MEKIKIIFFILLLTIIFAFVYFIFLKQNSENTYKIKTLEQKLIQSRQSLTTPNVELPDSIFVLSDTLIKRQDPLMFERIRFEILNYLYNKPGWIIHWLENKYLIDQLRFILVQNNIHPDFCYLRAVESNVIFDEQSPAGAKGIDQFMTYTATSFGLKISYSEGIDERFNPYKSGLAVAKYIQTLQKTYSQNFFILAGYNMSSKLKEIIQKSNGSHFFHLRRINGETYDYVPRLIAVKYIIENHTQLGFNNIKYHVPQPYQIIWIKSSHNILLRDLAQNIDMSLNQLYLLNPELIYNTIPAGYKYDFKIPPEKKEKTLLFLKKNKVTILN